MPTLKEGFEVNERDFKALKSKMDELRDLDETIAPNIMKRVGEEIAEEMWRYAPVDTGRLRREISFKSGDDWVTWESEAIDPQTKRDYAPLQEFGTRFFRAHPYFYPSLRGAIPELNHRLTQAIKTLWNRR